MQSLLAKILKHNIKTQKLAKKCVWFLFASLLKAYEVAAVVCL